MISHFWLNEVTVEMHLKNNSSTEIRIFDLLGNMIETRKLNSSDFTERIDVPNWSVGNYILSISANEGVIYNKFCKIN